MTSENECVRHDLCADPVIYWLDSFASEAECRHLQDRAACKLEVRSSSGNTAF